MLFNMRFFGLNPNEVVMSQTAVDTLTSIRTMDEMVEAFRDEKQCRSLLESMVWPEGRIQLAVTSAR